MDSPEAPTPPDPNQVSQGQYKSNVNTAVAQNTMNNVNTYGPMGSSVFTQTGTKKIGGVDVPTWEQHVTLNPELQALYDRYIGNQQQIGNIANAQLGNIAGAFGQPLNFDDIPSAPTADRGYYEDALFSRLNPQLERDRLAMENRLANQGIMPGSEAYREAIALSDRGMNDARMQALLQAGNYAQQEYGMGADARDRAVREKLMLRQQPLNELNALMSGSQATLPQFGGFQGASVQPTDYSGNVWNAYNAQNQAYQAQLGQQNAMMGGIAGLLGNAMTIPFMGGLGL
jgi:hypothetical protein